MWQLRPVPPRIALTHPSLDVRPADEMSSAGELEPTFMGTPGGSRTALAWTPDLQAIVFVGRGAGVRRLYVRRFDAAEARPLDNTEGAQVPAVSADGQWVAFWAGEAIKKVPLGGGPVMDLASGIVDPPRGLAWDIHGRLFFGRGDGGSIWVIPADGVPKAATTVGEGEVAHSLPWPLPDGRDAALHRAKTAVVVGRRGGGRADAGHGGSEGPAEGRRRCAIRADGSPGVPPPRRVVRRPVRCAAGGDSRHARRGARHGGAGVDRGEHRLRHWRWSVRDRGERGPGLGARPGGAVSRRAAGHGGPSRAGLASSGARAELRSRGARLAGRPTAGGDDSQPHRRRRLALRRGSRHHALLAGGGEAWIPIWSPDGRRLAFQWLSDGRRALAVQPADGTAPPQVLVSGDITVSSFTPDGRQIAAVRDSRDIVIVTVDPGQSRVQPADARLHNTLNAGRSSRRTGAGWRMGRTPRAGSRCTCVPTRAPVRRSRSRWMAAGVRRGLRPDASCSS